MTSQTTQTRIEDFLLRGLKKQRTFFNIVGSSSPTALSLLLSQSLSKDINGLPRLVVVSSLEEALAFEQHLSFFC